jgi:hypothetical protein
MPRSSSKPKDELAPKRNSRSRKKDTDENPNEGEPEPVQLAIFEGHSVEELRLSVVSAGNLTIEEVIPMGTPVRLVIEGFIAKVNHETKNRARRDGGRKVTVRRVIAKAETVKVEPLTPEKLK